MKLSVANTILLLLGIFIKMNGIAGDPLPDDINTEVEQDVNEENQIELRGNAEIKILRKIVKKLGVLDGKADSLEDVNSNQNTKLDIIIDRLADLSKKQDLLEVNVVSSHGKAYATTTHASGNFQPIKAFDGTGYWESGDPYTVPQALWVEFPKYIKVVGYSFTSRPDGLAAADGPSKYYFWGSNHGDCSDKTKWEILKEDNSGTPFTSTNHPKSEIIINISSYKCYGFAIADVPGRNGIKPVTIANVHLYAYQV